MPLAPNTINRILNNITDETEELSNTDYLEVLEELKDDIERRLNGVQNDIKLGERTRIAVAEMEEAKKIQELEAKRELDGSEGE